ncbi:TetR/AcrR family transcriptional regulator [Caproiciproducens sp. NJN-50]|uniref:TetR/AcrR family transcriptional regulator n=1 Tax=Acutalibacteraceae TaxID=3082771 RepID=UPI000FFE0BA3|nr:MULTISPECIES: TetR/AcrR family transcriptional regulator [Acutalibacteraceae]QAT49960.1 TetR/AcrR family transcriptional regulator [Caproiciproducens sp. NJN-50]
MKKDAENALLTKGPAENARKTRRQLQAMETKNKIYNAAVKKINELGFSNVSIEDITTEANVSKGSFYTYFESKRALVFYTFTQSDEIYKQAYEKVKGLDFLSMITRFMRISYTEYEKRGRGIIKAMIANYFTLEGYNFYGKDRPLLKCLEKIVESGKKEQVLDMRTETDKYVNILLSTMVGVEVMWCFESQDFSLADMIEDAVRVAAKGMMMR